MITRKQIGLLFGGGALALVVGVAGAGTPFGGDDSGFIPPPANLKCECGFSKIGGKYAAAVIGCHIKQAASLLAAKPFDEEVCETAARAKADAADLKLAGCPSCLDAAGLTAVLDYAVGQLDSTNGVFFCGGSTPIGGDDTGVVPTDKNVLKCEAGVLKGVGKLSAAIASCHCKYAAAVSASKTFDEEGCETAAKAKADAGNAKLAPLCAPCLSAVLPALSGLVESTIDLSNGGTFCASPSGAFIN